MAIPWPFHGHSITPKFASGSEDGSRKDGRLRYRSTVKQTFGVTGFIPHDRMGFSKPYTPRSRKARRPEIDRNCVPSISPVVFNICGGESRRQKDLPPMTEGENWPRTVSCCVADFCSFPRAPSVLSSDCLKSQDKFSVPSQENFASRRPKSHEGSAGDLQT